MQQLFTIVGGFITHSTAAVSMIVYLGDDRFLPALNYSWETAVFTCSAETCLYFLLVKWTPLASLYSLNNWPSNAEIKHFFFTKSWLNRYFMPRSCILIDCILRRTLNDHLSGKELFIRFTARAFRKLLFSCCQFMHLVISLLVLRAGFGSDCVSSCQIIAFLFTLDCVTRTVCSFIHVSLRQNLYLERCVCIIHIHYTLQLSAIILSIQRILAWLFTE